MVQVTLEDDEVRAREVEEQIRSFIEELPVGEASAPEGVLLVYPLALLFVLLHKIMNIHPKQVCNCTYLPAHAKTTKTVLLLLSSLREEVSVHHRVQEPLPVLLGHIRNEPGVPLAMEANFLCKPTLDQEVGCINREVSMESNSLLGGYLP